MICLGQYPMEDCLLPNLQLSKNYVIAVLPLNIHRP